jgi:hypothetical protein
VDIIEADEIDYSAGAQRLYQHPAIPAFPLARYVEDKGSPFVLDPDLPFLLEFGRGSAWHGLDIVKLFEDGTLTVHRQRIGKLRGEPFGFLEATTVRLGRKSVSRVLHAIEENEIMEMHRAYHANVYDGTQWILRIKQGENEKAIYCDNHFPRRILLFAAALDSELADSTLKYGQWRRVVDADSCRHEAALWDSIKR